MNALVSADSHVLEPGDLWRRRIDHAFRADAPRLVPGPAADDALLWADGLDAAPVSGFGAAGVDRDQLVEFQATGLSALRPGGWDPIARLVDQDVDGVEAEVLYPSLAMRLFGLRRADYQAACFRAYNDWLAELVSHDRRRLAGLALISVLDVDDAVREVARCDARGAVGFLIAVSAPAGTSYGEPRFDPLWRAIAATGRPVVLHVLTRADGERPPHGVAPVLHRYLDLVRDVQDSLADLVFGGVLERHPTLRVVSAENDAGWMPHLADRLDRAYDNFHAYEQVRLTRRPSEQLRAQVWLTFQCDPTAVRERHAIGVDRLLWGSDYPHLDSTWPASAAVLDAQFGGVEADERAQIVRANARALFWGEP